MEYLTQETFKQKIFNFDENEEWKFEGDKPAIIDFYADWCGPCKQLEPTIEQVEHEYQGQIDVYKIDTEQQQELAGAFGIKSIPAILFVPLSGQPQMVNGVIDKSSFDQAINEIFFSNAASEAESESESE